MTKINVPSKETTHVYMVQTKGLVKNFMIGKIELKVLKSINFEVKKGEFVALMGPSGSGKSTLLHQLGLLDTPTSGDIFIDGKKVGDLDDDEKTIFRLNHLGYVFQDYALLPELTALENIYLPGIAMGKGSEFCKKRAMELIMAVGIQGRENHLPSELSGGQQQRVAIARALMNDPKILFADEPTANLDSESGLQILELFKKVNKEYSQTIVMVSHEDEHSSFVDRIIRLKDGMIEKP